MYALFAVLDVVMLIAGWIVPFVLMSRADRRYHRRVDTTLDRLVRRGVVRTEAGAFAVVADHSPGLRRAERRVVDAVLEVGRGGLPAVRAEAHPRPRRDWHVAAHCLVITAITATITVGVMVTAPEPHDEHPVMVIVLIALQLGWLLPPTVIGVIERTRYRSLRQEY